MGSKLIINNWLFRILAPPLFGLLVYVMVLLLFDSISQLLIHFINIEYFVCVALCFVNFELLRILIIICNKKCHTKIGYQITIQIILSLVLSITITGILIHIYFKFLVGIINFQSELIIFCSILGASALFYNAIYLSQYLQTFKHQNAIIEQEKMNKEAQKRWSQFQNKINPTLLYKSLEQLIGLAHTNKNEADVYLKNLSEIYRQILESSEELIPIKKELNLLKQVSQLLHINYNNNIDITIVELPNSKSSHITPGFLLLSTQNIINTNIISHTQPFKLKIIENKNTIEIVYIENKRLNINEQKTIELTSEKELLQWYTKNEIIIHKNQNTKTIEIPLVKIDE